MTPAQDAPKQLIWATRGRSWGFRFLLDGGFADPLPEYESAFADVGEEPAAWCRAAGKVALRFPDPLGRTDAAGRVIPHEFVILGESAADICSAEEGLRRVWPLVQSAYEQVWDAKTPPSGADLRFTG